VGSHGLTIIKESTSGEAKKFDLLGALCVGRALSGAGAGWERVGLGLAFRKVAHCLCCDRHATILYKDREQAPRLPIVDLKFFPHSIFVNDSRQHFVVFMA